MGIIGSVVRAVSNPPDCECEDEKNSRHNSASQLGGRIGNANQTVIVRMVDLLGTRDTRKKALHRSCTTFVGQPVPHSQTASTSWNGK